jgi:hypothetical protein
LRLLNREERLPVATKSYAWVKPGIGGAVIGVVGIMVLGFWSFGWVLGSKANQMASDRATIAVAEALAPACAAKFFAEADAPAKLAELKKLTSDYAQRDFIQKGGWATAIDARTPDYQLAIECTKKILAAKPA